MNKFRPIYCILLFVFCATNLFGQGEQKSRVVHFILVDDKSYPDVISVNSKDEQGTCESIKTWVNSNEQNYFMLLQKPDVAVTVNSDSIKTWPIQNQKDFMLCMEKLRSSMQCQRFQLIFSKSERVSIHHDKVISQYYYIVSKNDFLDLKNKMRQ